MSESQAREKRYRRPTLGAHKKTPQCMIFTCERKSDDPCCFYCVKKVECGEAACKNNPERCGKCMMPAEKKEEGKTVNRYDIPDHPVIRHAERFGGSASYNASDDPICPECNQKCLICYVDRFGQVIGCDHCISSRNAAAYLGRVDQ